MPKANGGPIKIPDTLADEQVLFLSDILPTGYQASVNADVGPGSSIAIFGAGPVGLMAAACARVLGVEKIFMVDHHPYRLEFARQTYEVFPINFRCPCGNAGDHATSVYNNTHHVHELRPSHRLIHAESLGRQGVAGLAPVVMNRTQVRGL